MNGIKEGWFSEINDLWPGVALSLEVEKVIYEGKSKYQDVKVLQTKAHGKALILDGIIQCTEADEFSYQEMIAFLPLCSHPDPKKVLIVGGGDGGVAREVCKHPSVEKADLVEIDEMVIEVSKKYLPNMSIGFSNPKLTLHVEDGFKFMQKHSKEYDVIITDSSDPIGPAVSLFQKEYFELMQSALKPGGIVCSQAGTVWTNLDQVVNTVALCKQIFPKYAFGITSVPTYPSGQIGFAMGSMQKETNFKEPLRIFNEEEMDKMGLRYYTPEVHRAAFVLPRFAQKAVL